MTPNEFGPHYTSDGKRYLLRLPESAKAKGYTRATTFAKTLDDEANLGPWMGTMGIVGVLRSTPIRTEWQALLAEHPDPWYSTQESKERARALVEKAKEAGGAGDRRDTGTALHTILHLVATGWCKAGDVDEEWRAHVVAAVKVLTDAGLRIRPELCELAVYNPTYNTVGRFDLIVEDIATGALHIADWKTGGATWIPKKDYRTKRQTGWRDGYEMADGMHCGQLALYATAESVIVWPEDQWQECTLAPMPPIDQHRAFIVHLPSKETACASLRILDLDAGRTWLDACLLVRDVRKRKPLIERLGAVEPALPTTEDECTSSGAADVPGSSVFDTSALVGVPSSSAMSAAESSLDRSSAEQPADAFDGLVDGYVAPPAKPERRAWVIGRLETLAGIDGALALAKAKWPAGLATLKQSDRHTDADLDRIVKMICAVEDQLLAPFNVPDPTIEKEEGRWTTSTNDSPTHSDEPSSTSPLPLDTSLPAIEATSPSTSSLPTARSMTSSENSASPDEGPDADEAAVAALHAAYEALPAEGRSWIAGLARDAQQAGRPIHLQGAATIRRFEIVRGLVALAGNGCDDDDVVRGLVALANFVATFSAEFSASTSAGALVSCLHAEDATKFARLCDALTNGDLVASVADDGVMRFAGA